MAFIGALIAMTLPLASLAVHVQGSIRSRLHQRQPAAPLETCTELVNHGAYFSVDIEVGSPGQKFSVIADTGSNSVIVPSCKCKESGFCAKEVRCFVGTNRSSSFRLKSGPKGPESLIIGFGSGLVQGVVAQDMVKVGQIKADMPRGVVLMTAQKLNMVGNFEGILGLGVPQRDEPQAPEANSSAPGQMPFPFPGGEGGQMPFPMPGGEGGEVPPEIQEVIKQVMDQMKQGTSSQGGQQGSIATVSSGLSPRHPQPVNLSNATSQSGAQVPGMGMEQRPPAGFLEQAGITRFSMCFNEGANGVLRLGTPAAPLAHGSVGKEHWGLDFRGMTVGNSSVPVQACLRSQMMPGQETPCGAIPDSGTTLIMAPEEHLSLLFTDICDRWDRCRQNHSAIVRAAAAASKAAAAEYGIDPFGLQPPSKAQVLQRVLLDCRVWSKAGHGLDELPPIHFQIAGTNGTVQNLTLPGHAYILESELEEHTNGSAVNVTLAARESVCVPAFGPMSMVTQKNGPVWIFGTSFFYEFTVGYDLGTVPPAVAFTPKSETPCGACSSEVNLAALRRHAPSADAGARRPRRLTRAPRKSSVDVRRPL